MIKAVIFDFGGVLTYGGRWEDFARNNHSKFNTTYEELMEGIEKYWQAAKVNKKNSNQFWDKLAEFLNYDKDKLRLVAEEHFIFNEDVLDLIKKLKKDYKLALLSNHIDDWLGEEIRKRKLGEIFDVIVLSCEVELAKPDPRIYQKTLKKLNLEPEQCLFVDDKEKNLKPARKMGIKTIQFQNLDQLINDLGKLGVMVK